MLQYVVQLSGIDYIFFLMFKGGSKVLFVILCPLAVGVLIHLSPSGCLSGLVVFTAVLWSNALSVTQSKSGGDRPRCPAVSLFGKILAPCILLRGALSTIILHVAYQGIRFLGLPVLF